MARVQTRRSISVSAAGHERIAALAAAAGLSVSGYVERKLIAELPQPEPVKAQSRQARGRRR